MSKYADLHLHSMDLFDSDNAPERVCERMKELGAKGFALTQHGVLSGIEPMKDACDKYGLKFIPGIETYYGEDGDLRKNKHLILLSENYDGYHAIWKAVSEAQNQDGYSVMNEKILRKHFGEGTNGHGNVIATTACINGVVAMVLRSNETVDREIAKVQRKLDRLDIDISRVETLKSKIEELEASLSEEMDGKKMLKAIADQKFAKIEKYVEKLRVSNDPTYETEAKNLQEKKESAAEAKKELAQCDSRITKLKRQISTYKAEYKDVESKASKYNSYVEEIAKFTAMKSTDEALLEDAIKETEKFQSIFGKDNFFIEIQNHGIEEEEVVYTKMVEIAKKLDIPLVATNDVHTVSNSKDELLRRKIMRAMRFEQWEGNQVGDDQLYIKTDEEMIDWLGRIFPEEIVEEAMNNIKVIFDRCNVEFPTETHYPKFPVGENETANSRLIREIKKGIAWRFPEGLDEAHRDRLNYEFGIIRQMGYQDYHLIVKDFLEYGRALGPVPDDKIEEAPFDIDELKAWVKENGWQTGFTIGPGRGSAVGSLVCYCLGITNLDPLKYDLLFERE